MTGQALPSAVVTKDSGSNLGNFVQNIVSFDIPCGQGMGVFLDPRETILNFRLTWVVTTSYTAGASSETKCNLIGSASSFFDSLTLYHNNTPLEIVQNYALLFNNLLNGSVNNSERWGGVSISMGSDTNTSTGCDLTLAQGTYFSTLQFLSSVS